MDKFGDLEEIVFEAMFGREYKGERTDDHNCTVVDRVSNAVQRYYSSLHDYPGEDQ